MAKAAHRLLISELGISLAHEKSTAIRSREMSRRWCTRLHSRSHHKLLVACILVASFRRPAARHFQLSILHNIGHLVFGVAGVAGGSHVSGARNYLVGAGLIYLVSSLL